MSSGVAAVERPPSEEAAAAMAEEKMVGGSGGVWSRVKETLMYDPPPGTPLPGYLFFKNRWFRGCVFLLMCLLNTLVYYGWQQFSQMLFRHGAYRWRCDEASLTDRDDYCQAQYNAVQTLYTVGLACEFIFGVVAGVLLDHVGPWFTGFFGAVFYFLGWMCLMYSSESAQLYIPGMVLLAGSVNLVAFPCLCLADLFPTRGGLALSLVVAAQTLCTSVAPILMLIWDQHPSLTYETLIWGYLAVGFFPAGLLYLLALPYKRLIFDRPEPLPPPPGPSVSPSSAAFLENAEAAGHVSSGLPSLAIPSRDSLSATATREFIGVKELSMQFTQQRTTFLRQVASPEYIMFTLFYVLQLLQFGYYPTTVLDQFGRDVSNFQGYVLPTQAVFGTLFGLVVDRVKTPLICFALVLAMTGAYALALVRNTGLQYLTSMLYVVSNSYIYTVKYTYVAEIFPAQHFGVLIGLIGCIAGVITLVNIPIQNANNYTATCIAFIGVGVAAFFVVAWCYWRQKRGYHYRNVTPENERKKLVDDAEAEKLDSSPFPTA